MCMNIILRSIVGKKKTNLSSIHVHIQHYIRSPRQHNTRKKKIGIWDCLQCLH